MNVFSLPSSLAVGNQLGLIRVYNLNLKETSLHIVIGVKQQGQGGGLKCSARFHLLDSLFKPFSIMDHGSKLAVVHECGGVAVLDMKLFSVLFMSDSLPNPKSRVISIKWKAFVYNGSHVKSPNILGQKNLEISVESLMFVFTKDAKLYLFGGDDYRMVNSKPMQLKKGTTAISMHIIGKYDSK
ncbi:hypothetical protein L2E82_36212 [Cichorium intybus]|uniref:Uncharacterized protein n=1 Tax=Cichorium intybus TaxID=13427 RepID=A0ACB9BR18_CICIN|nr:hypothetical protein L2E82_36212 [Cichorium intybus]